MTSEMKIPVKIASDMVATMTDTSHLIKVIFEVICHVSYTDKP